MTKLMMYGAMLLVVCCGNAWGQGGPGQASKFSFVATSGGAGSSDPILCQTPADAPDALCPDAYWFFRDSDNTIPFDGDAGMQAHAGYGLLQAQGSAVVSSHVGNTAAGAARTGAGAQANFLDTFTFSGLAGSGPYVLVVDLNLVGVTGGEFLRPNSTIQVYAYANLADVSTGNSGSCSPAIDHADTIPGVFKQTCSSRMQFFPGDTVILTGQLILAINAVVPESTSTSGITQNPQADFLTGGKFSGARYAVHIEDAKGRKVNKGEILTASGVAYPTH